MEESEDNMSAEDTGNQDSLLIVRAKSKKRSLVERELETNMTARVTSPIYKVDATSTSRYGRARRLKRDSEYVTDTDPVVSKITSPSFEMTPVKVQSPVYKMHASNSPVKPESSKCTPKKISVESNLDDQIESIYHENISLSRFGTDEKKISSPRKTPKVYVRKDLIQKRYQDEETMSIMKNMFSPVKSSQKSKSHLSNILERSSEKYSLNIGHNKSQNGLSSVVKTLDFDNKRKKKDNGDAKAIASKSDLFDVEAKCEYQVGDLAWARMGTYPFWPCIITREPSSGMFVKKKLFGRIEHDIIHVTFFGDNGRRSWIVDNLLRKFLGQLEFEATREKFTPSDKKRDPRFYAAFFISEKKQLQWNISVEEAEMLLREPKRLRIDLLYDMIHKSRAVKTTPKQSKSGKITRTASDVSLSESLYDSLFSEDDGKAEDTDRSRNKSRNKSLDVSEVVTACLDNMAAKTGITKIQRQSHMDRWLQKAKSKTPEKSHAKAQAMVKKVDKGTKTTSSKKKKRLSPKLIISHKPYSFRKYANESQKSVAHYFDCGTNFEPELSSTLNSVDNNESLNNIECIEELQSGIGIISKVESLSDNIVKENNRKCEQTQKIEIEINSEDQVIDENNIEQKKNIVGHFLSENIKTDKSNVIYDIEIKVNASSVQDEDQIKKYAAMCTDKKVDIALLVSDETIGDYVKFQDTSEKNNDSDVEEPKTNEDVINQCIEKINQTKPDNIEQFISILPDTNPESENSIPEIKVNKSIEMSFKENNETSLNDEECTPKVKINDNTEDSRSESVDKQVIMITNESHTQSNILNCTTVVNAENNTVKPFDKDTESNEMSLNKVDSTEEVKINNSREDGHETKLIEEHEQIINYEPLTKTDTEKCMTEDKVTDITKMLIDEVMEDNERFLNKEYTMRDIKTNDDTVEYQQIKIIDNKKQIINFKPEQCPNNDNTIMFNEEDMKPDGLSLKEESNIMEAEQKHNTEFIIDIQPDDDCDSIVHKTILTQGFCDRLDTSDTNQNDVSEEEIECKSNRIDKQEVLEKISGNIRFKTKKTSVGKGESKNVSSIVSGDITLNVSYEIDGQNIQKVSYENSSCVTTGSSKAESNIMCNANSNTLSEDLEHPIVKKSEAIDEQIVEEASLENISFKSINAKIPNGESTVMEHDKRFTRVIHNSGQKDKCLAQSIGNVLESSIFTETETKINFRKNSDTFDDTNSNQLNKIPDLGLKDMKFTQDVRNSRIHYVTFDKSVGDEDDLFTHLPVINSLVMEVSKNSNISSDRKFKRDIREVTEVSSEPKENDLEDNILEDKPTSEVKGNDKNLVQTANIVRAVIDQPLSNCNLEKVVDKHTIVDSYNSDSVPNITNSIVSSIFSASEPLMVNGFHSPKRLEDFDGDTSSINSEDIEPLSVTRNKMLQGKVKSKLDDPEFVTYLEIRQDDMIAEHPELNENQIIDYLYETWMYEKSNKSDIRRNYEIQQLNLVKGLDSKPECSRKRYTKGRKHITKERKKRNAVDNSDYDTASIKSGDSITSTKRSLRPKKSALYIEIFFDDSRGTTPDKIKDEVDIDTASLCSIESELSNEVPKIEIELTPINSSTESKTDTASINLRDIDSEATKTKSRTTRHSSSIKLNKLKEIDATDKDMNTASSLISTSKPKQKFKCVDSNEISLDNPEFVKYLELRQDTLTDENPHLTHEEIVRYLYKTWLYDESVKSDMMKTYEFEESNLVKGLTTDQDVQPKKIKKKIKLEKDLKDFIVDDNVIIKDKPKRKTAQANYYNEDFSDLEDEIQMFEVLKGMPVPQVQLTKLPERTSNDNVVIEILDEVDEVELYFKELVKPKPNLFKGLIREKVCEICERTGNLVKCKSCNSMFHIICVKNQSDVVEPLVLPLRGRKKKKKKASHKSKNLEDSQSDEKSQDVSTELDIKVELQPCTVDAENFEAQLEAKMKELLESTKTEIHYDSYSSDDGIDWSDAVAGKCEIVDVKLKRKSSNNDYSDFKCNNCVKYEVPTCFVCKLVISKTGVDHKQKCQVAHCHKYYHLECLDHWPQTQFTSGDQDKKTKEVFDNLMCPRHVCHTCVSDDPRGCNTRFSGDKLARCVRCPATYHTFTKCVPAGTEILTGSHIICPRHYDHRPGKVPYHVNTGWCFICAVGGTLICCEYCPTSFHAECLNIKPPEGSYMCEDCETGRLPLYGEMVWVKLGHYRWWPGIILHPSEIPDNLLAVKHLPGEFVVRFFGQYDHYWVNRGRVFPFQEGDSGRISSHKSKINADFTTAMEHAYRACEILKAAPPNDVESLDIASSLLPPHYVKLKVNKPFGSLCGRRVDVEESSLTQCECNPEEEDPCGPYSQCLNRMLLTECGPICRAGDRCNNRAFEKRLYPKMVPYRTHYRGWGLKTLEDIKAGQFVIEYVGELIDEEEFRRRMNRKHEIRDENFYFLTLDKERMIDAGPKGNLARFMNHCCEPNCETQKWTVLGDVRVGLFAIHDIPANSEVTFNYNLECAGIDKKRCLCGAKRCPGYIGAKPKQDESQPKKPKFAAKRTYKKRKNTEESPSTKNKPKRPVGRPAKPRELTEIEKDLLIIKNATNGLSSDSDCSRLSSMDGDKNQKALKRKRVSFSTEDSVLCNSGKSSPSVKKIKLEKVKSEGVL